MKKITLGLIDMKAQTIKDVYDAYIKLYDNHLEYHVHFLSEDMVDPEDKLLGTEDNTTNFTLFFKKSAMVGVEKTITVHDQWCVAILVMGAEDLKFFFEIKEEEKAAELMNTLKEWLMS